MKEELIKSTYYFDKKLLDITNEIRDLGLRIYTRDKFWDKKVEKILLNTNDLDKYNRIIKNLINIIEDSNNYYYHLRRSIQEGIKYLISLRDQYKPPYNCDWFNNYSGDWVSGDKVKNDVGSLLADLLGDRVCNIKNTRVKFNRQGNLVIQFGINKTPKIILFSIPGIIDIYKERILGEDEDEYDPTRIDDYIPKFTILFDTGLGSESISISHDMTQFDLFKKDLVNIFDYDVNKSIPEKPELNELMSYEGFINWKINRIANNIINS